MKKKNSREEFSPGTLISRYAFPSSRYLILSEAYLTQLGWVINVFGFSTGKLRTIGFEGIENYYEICG